MLKIASITGLIVILATAFLLLPELQKTEYIAASPLGAAVLKEVKNEEPQVPEFDNRQVVRHVPLPSSTKSIYMSSCVAGTPSFREKLVTFANETEINAIVIDVKDYSGSISFPPAGGEWSYAWEAAACGARDMKDFISYLHDNNIFVIGRVTVFQDPLYTQRHPEDAVKRADGVTIWKDHKGLSFIDVGAQNYWDHLVALVVESYNVGFDEINFDYVRYPSDGPMSDISFTHADGSKYGKDKPANLEAFFAYLHEKVSDEAAYQTFKHEGTGREKSIPYTSADLFGMTTTNSDDLSIGQVLERAVPYFDFIAPMVYPSHYPSSFLGLGNPNDYPYKVVNYSMQFAVNRLTASTTSIAGFKHEPITITNASGTVVQTGKNSKPVYTARKLRTWIQDFDYGGDYDAADVRAQIQASYDAGVMDYMVWAPSNIYTKAAFLQ